MPRVVASLWLLVVGALCVGSPAQAWTETRVVGMRAHLDVRPDGAALVGLRVRIRVLGGWVSRFDLHGLDPQLELDADKPPFLISDDGTKFVPEVQQRRDGELRFVFPRRHNAPRRGYHELGLLYRTQLPLSSAPDGLPRRAEWTLPAWQSALRDVSISIVAPMGSRLVEPEDLSEHAAVSTQSATRGPFEFLSMQRVYLPRTVAWGVRIDLPEASGALALSPAEGESLDEPWSHIWPMDWRAIAGALVLAALSLLKLASRRKRGELVSVMLVPGPLGWPRAALIVVGALVAGLIYPHDPNLALPLLVLCVALSLLRHSRLRQPPSSDHTRPAHQVDLLRARRARLIRWVGPASWLDATTPLGAALLGTLWTAIGLACAAAVPLEGWLTAGMLLSALLLNGTRMQDPLGDEAALLELERLRPLLKRAGLHAELRVSGQPGDRATRPRLHVRPSVPATSQAELRVCCQAQPYGGSRPLFAISGQPGQQPTLTGHPVSACQALLHASPPEPEAVADAA